MSLLSWSIRHPRAGARLTVYLLYQGAIVYSGASAGLDEDAIFDLYSGAERGTGNARMSVIFTFRRRRTHLRRAVRPRGHGLTLTYKISGVLNFAQGAVAIVAVDAYIYLTFDRGYSWRRPG